jgi:hypothetical protein
MTNEVHGSLWTILLDGHNKGGQPTAFFEVIAVIDVID